MNAMELQKQLQEAANKLLILVGMEREETWRVIGEVSGDILAVKRELPYLYNAAYMAGVEAGAEEVADDRAVEYDRCGEELRGR